MDLFSVFSRMNEDLREPYTLPSETQKDLSRGKENELSKEAFEKVDTKKGQTDVFNLIDGFLCTFEIAEKLGKPIHKLSGRFTELKKLNKIKFKSKKNINGSNYSIYEKYF